MNIAGAVSVDTIPTHLSLLYGSDTIKMKSSVAHTLVRFLNQLSNRSERQFCHSSLLCVLLTIYIFFPLSPTVWLDHCLLFLTVAQLLPMPSSVHLLFYFSSSTVLAFSPFLTAYTVALSASFGVRSNFINVFPTEFNKIYDMQQVYNTYWFLMFEHFQFYWWHLFLYLCKLYIIFKWMGSQNKCLK